MADVIKPDFVGVLALRLHPHVCAKIATALPGINDSLRCRVSVTASDLVAHAASAKNPRASVARRSNLECLTLSSMRSAC